MTGHVNIGVERLRLDFMELQVVLRSGWLRQCLDSCVSVCALWLMLLAAAGCVSFAFELGTCSLHLCPPV